MKRRFLPLTVLSFFLLLAPLGQASESSIPGPIRAGTQDFVVTWIRSVITRKQEVGALPESMPAELRRPGEEKIVISLLSPGRRPLAALGQAENLGNAVAVALRSLDRQFGARFGENLARQVRIRVDRLGSLQPLGRMSPSIFQAPGFSPGVHGLSLQGYERQALLLPYEAILQGLSERETVQGGEVMEKLLEGLGASGSAPDAMVQTFRTRAFQESKPGVAVETHRLMPRISSFTPETLDRSLALLAGRLGRVQRQDGGFLYFFDPVKGKNLGGENYVRQAAVVATAIEMLPLRPAGKVLEEVVSRGLAFLLRTLEKHDVGGGKTLRVPPPDRKDGPSLGAVALYARALAIAPTQYSDLPALVAARTQLGRALAFMQRPDGSWYQNLGQAKRGEPPTAKPRFFPGEALLALSDLAYVDPEGPWLKLARRSAARERSDFKRTGVFDHWIVQGLARYSGLTDDPDAARLAYQMAREMVRSQVLGGDAWDPADRGGFALPNGLVTVAHSSCYGEALREARKVAWRFGFDPRPLEASLIRLGTYLAGQQFRPEGSAVLRHRRYSVGGFPTSSSDFRIRIDVDGHAGRALLGAWESLHDLRPTPQLAELVERVGSNAG